MIRPMNKRLSSIVRNGLLIGLGVYAMQTLQVQADTDDEREALARLVHELKALEPLIVEASRAADPDARVRFQYDWLRQDLAIVRRGIEAHLEAPRSEPRPFPPLRGDYRR